MTFQNELSILLERKLGNPEKERAEQAQFEAWLTSLGRKFELHTEETWWGSHPPKYRDRWTEGQWRGWLARANWKNI